MKKTSILIKILMILVLLTMTKVIIVLYIWDEAMIIIQRKLCNKTERSGFTLA